MIITVNMIQIKTIIIMGPEVIITMTGSAVF